MGTFSGLRRPVPAWWLDAKLGIFVHWTPASVAGFAPTHVEIGDLLASTDPTALAETPYTEWYENSLRFPGSSVAAHHRDVWGDRPYRAFGEDFRQGLASWDPDAWARAFAATGARYVVLVAKHHDGFCLWPSDVGNPNVAGWHTGRDVVGELAEAVRSQGLRFGLYYSGGLDWTFEDHPIGCVPDTVLAVPRGGYPAYAEAQVRELVRRYRPSVLWNDILWPGGRRDLARLFADYYAAVPDGVVNDRWLPFHPAMRAVAWGPAHRAVLRSSATSSRRADGLVPPTPPHFDVRTPEYTVFDEVQRRPWECVRGIDRSFGFNRASDPGHFLGRADLLRSLGGIAAAGGNLLLNVGPRGEDAAIPDEQQQRLDWLARWTEVHGDGLFATRPWVRVGERTTEGHEVRYTCRDRQVFAHVDGDGPTTLASVSATPTTAVTGPDGQPRPWSAATGGLRVEVPPQGDGPTVVVLTDVTAAPVR